MLYKFFYNLVYCVLVVITIFLNCYAVTYLPNNSAKAQQFLYSKLLGSSHPQDISIEGVAFKINKLNTIPATATTNNLIISPINLFTIQDIVDYSSITNSLQLGTNTNQYVIYANTPTAALIIGSEVTATKTQYQFVPSSSASITLSNLHINNLLIDGNSTAISNIKGDGIIIIGNNTFNLLNPLIIGKQVQIIADNHHHCLHIASKIYGDISNNGQLLTTSNSINSIGLLATMPIVGTITNNGKISGGLAALLIHPLIIEATSCRIINNGHIEGNILVNAASITSYATVTLQNNFSANITKAKIKFYGNTNFVVTNDGKIEANEVSITKLINNNNIIIQGANGYIANDNIFENNSKASTQVNNTLLVNGILTNYGQLTANTLTMANNNCQIINNGTIRAQHIVSCNISGTHTTIINNSIFGEVTISGTLILDGKINQFATATVNNLISKPNSNFINNGSLAIVNLATINKLINNNYLIANASLDLKQQSINYGRLFAKNFSCEEFINDATASFNLLSANRADIQNRGYLSVNKAIAGNINIEGNLILTDDITNTANLNLSKLLKSSNIFYNSGNVEVEDASLLQLFNNKLAKFTIDNKLILTKKSYNEGTLIVGEFNLPDSLINKNFAHLHAINESTINNSSANAILLVDFGLSGNVVINGTLDIDKTVTNRGTVSVTNIKPYVLSTPAKLINHNGVMHITNNLLISELMNNVNATITVKNKLIVTNKKSQSYNNGNIIAHSLENSYFYKNYGTINLQEINNSIIQTSDGVVMVASCTVGDVQIGGELLLSGNLNQQGTLTALEITGASNTLNNHGIVNVYNFNNFFNTVRKSLSGQFVIQKLINSGTIIVQGSTTIYKKSINNKCLLSNALKSTATLTNDGFAQIGVLTNSNIINNNTLTVYSKFIGNNNITGGIQITRISLKQKSHIINYGTLTVSSTLDGKYNTIINQGTIIANNLRNIFVKKDRLHAGVIKVANKTDGMVSIEGTITLIGNLNNSGIFFCDSISGKDYSFTSEGTSSINNNLVIDNLNINQGYCVIKNNLILYNTKIDSFNNGNLHVSRLNIKNNKLRNKKMLEIGILRSGYIINEGTLQLNKANLGLSVIVGDVIAGGDLINKSAIRIEKGSLFASNYSLRNMYSNDINVGNNVILSKLINDSSSILLIGGTLSVSSAINKGSIKLANMYNSTITNSGTILLANSTSGSVTIVGDLRVKKDVYQRGYLRSINIIGAGSITNLGYIKSNNITCKLIINNNTINVESTISIEDKLINNSKIITKNIDLLDHGYIYNNKGAEFTLMSSSITMSNRIIYNHGLLAIYGSLNLNDNLDSYGNLIINKLYGNNHKLIIHKNTQAIISQLGKKNDNLYIAVCGSLTLTAFNTTTNNISNISKISGDIIISSSSTLLPNENHDGIINLNNNVQQISGSLKLGSLSADIPVSFQINKYCSCKLTQSINSNKITVYNLGELDVPQGSNLWRYEGLSNSRLIIRVNQDIAKISKPLLQTEDILTFATNSAVAITHVAGKQVIAGSRRIDLIRASGGMLCNNKQLTQEIAKKIIYYQDNQSILITVKEVEVNKNTISAEVGVANNPLPVSSNVALINLSNKLLGDCQPMNYHVDALIWYDKQDLKNKTNSNNNLAVFPLDVALNKSIVNYSTKSLVIDIGNNNQQQQLYSHASRIIDYPALIVASEVEPNISHNIKRNDPIILHKMVLNNVMIDGSHKLVEVNGIVQKLATNQDALIFLGKNILKFIDTDSINISDKVKLIAGNNNHALHLAMPIIGNIENNAQIGSNNTGIGIQITQMISGTITNNKIIHGKHTGININLLHPVLAQQANRLVLINNNTIINGINIKSVANKTPPEVVLHNHKLIKGGVLQTNSTVLLDVINYKGSYIEVDHVNLTSLFNFAIIKITGENTFTVHNKRFINAGTIEIANIINLNANIENFGCLAAKHIRGNNNTVTNEVSSSANFKTIDNCIFKNKGLITVSSVTSGRVVILGDLQLVNNIQQSGTLLVTNINGNYGISNNHILDVEQNLNITFLNNNDTVNVGKLLSLTKKSHNNKNLTAGTITSIVTLNNATTGNIKVNNINNLICNNTGNFYVINKISGEVTISGSLTFTGNVINDGKLYAKNIIGSKYSFTNNNYVNTDNISVKTIDNYGELIINSDLSLNQDFINKGYLAVNDIIYNKAKFTNLASATLQINTSVFRFNKELFTNFGNLKINNICLLDSNLNNQGILEARILNGNYYTIFNGKNNKVKCNIIKNIYISGSKTIDISKHIIGSVTITSGISLESNTTVTGNLNTSSIKLNNNKLINKYGSKIITKDDLALSNNNFINNGFLMTTKNIELIDILINNGELSCNKLQGNANKLLNNATITCNTLADINIVNKKTLQVKNEIAGNVVIDGELRLIGSIMQQGNLVAHSITTINNQSNNITFNIAYNSEVNIDTLNASNLDIKNCGLLNVTNNTKLNSYHGKAGTIIININDKTNFQQPLLELNQNLELMHFQGKESLIVISAVDNINIGKVKDKACILTAKEVLINGKLLQLNDLSIIMAVKKINAKNLLIDLSSLTVSRANNKASIIADITCKAIDAAIDIGDQAVSIKKFANLMQKYKIDSNKPHLMQMIREEIRLNRLPIEAEEIVEYLLYKQQVTNQQEFKEIRDSLLSAIHLREKLNIVKRLLPDNCYVNNQLLVNVSNKLLKIISQRFRVFREQRCYQYKLNSTEFNFDNSLKNIWFASNLETKQQYTYNKDVTAVDINKTTSIGLEQQFTAKIKLGIMQSHAITNLTNITLRGYQLVDRNSSITNMATTIYAQYEMKKFIIQSALQYSINSHKHNIKIITDRNQQQHRYKSKLTSFIIEAVVPYYYNNFYCEFNSSLTLLNNVLPARNFNNIERYNSQSSNIINLATAVHIYRNFSLKSGNRVNIYCSIAYNKVLNLSQKDITKVILFDKKFNLNNFSSDSSKLITNLAVNYVVNNKITTDISISYNRNLFNNIASAKISIKYNY